MTIDPRFERSVRRCLRAYPRRWRAQRADEVTAVLADLADDGATRLDVRSSAGLVVAGWRERLRTRPPVRQVVAYRLLGRRLPVRYRGWVRDDIEGASYVVRTWSLPFFVGLVMVVPLLSLLSGGPLHLPAGNVVVAWLVTAALMPLVQGPSRRRRSARTHLVVRPDEPVTAESLLFGWVLRDRLAARGTTGMLTSGLVVAGLAAVVATLGRDDVAPSVSAVLCAALLAGALLALLARLHLRRLVPVRPAQHARRLVPPGWRHRLVTVLLTASCVALSWSEATGRTDLALSVVLAVGALLALPAALVAHRVACSGPDDLALVDVLTITATGGLPRVDTYREGLVPALVSTD